MKDDNTLPSIRQDIKRIRDDIGVAGDSLLIGPRDTATTADRRYSKLMSRLLDFRQHSTGGGRISPGDVSNAFIQVIKRIGRPEYGTFQRSPRSTASIVASNLAIASSCGTRRPAVISASPRSIPSIISASRATYRVIASAARKDFVR